MMKSAFGFSTQTVATFVDMAGSVSKIILALLKMVSPGINGLWGFIRYQSVPCELSGFTEVGVRTIGEKVNCKRLFRPNVGIQGCVLPRNSNDVGSRRGSRRSLTITCFAFPVPMFSKFMVYRRKSAMLESTTGVDTSLLLGSYGRRSVINIVLEALLL